MDGLGNSDAHIWVRVGTSTFSGAFLVKALTNEVNDALRAPLEVKI